MPLLEIPLPVKLLRVMVELPQVGSWAKPTNEVGSSLVPLLTLAVSVTVPLRFVRLPSGVGQRATPPNMVVLWLLPSTCSLSMVVVALPVVFLSLIRPPPSPERQVEQRGTESVGVELGRLLSLTFVVVVVLLLLQLLA